MRRSVIALLSLVILIAVAGSAGALLLLHSGSSGIGVTPTVTISLSNGSGFPLPANSGSAIDTIAVACSPAACGTPTFTLATQTGCASTNNSSFAIAGTSLNIGSTTINDTTTRNICIDASIVGQPDTFQSFALTGFVSHIDGTVATGQTATLALAAGPYVGTWGFNSTTNSCGDFQVTYNGVPWVNGGYADAYFVLNNILYNYTAAPGCPASKGWWQNTTTGWTHLASAPQEPSIPSQPVWVTVSAPACTSPITVPCQATDGSFKIPDTTKAGAVIATVSVATTDGATFAGSLTTTPNTVYLTNSSYQLVAARNFSTSDDNAVYSTTVEAIPATQPTLGPEALDNLQFTAQAGNAGTTIGNLSMQRSFGQAAPNYTLVTTCGAACADSALFAISGTALKIGSADITSARQYKVTVRDTEDASNNPFDVAYTLTGNPGVVAQAIGSVTQFTASTQFSAGTPSATVGAVAVNMNPSSPPFTGGVTITGANSCGFYLDSNTLPANVLSNPSGGCSATGGPHSNGLYDDWNIVAAQATASNSPFTQAEAATAIAAAAQQIGIVTQFTTKIPANTANAAVGTVAVRMCPSSTSTTCTLTNDTPKFSGSLAISGANSCGFHLSGAAVLAGPSGCSATGGPHSNGLYDDWNVVASQAGVPTFTQAETATAVTTIGTGPAQWTVMHQDGCFEVSGTTSSLSPPNIWSCQFRYRDSFAQDSFVVGVAWRLNNGSAGTAPSITSVALANNPALCALIPGTYINDPTTSIAISLYLCPNMSYGMSKLDITFASAAQLVLVRTTEIYGCTNPCVAEVGNSVITPSANGTMSIATSGPTTAANDFVMSFAYGAWSSFSAPSGTVISNATSGVSSFLTQYQIGAATGTYTNSFTNSNAHTNVLQAIVAFKRNAAPPAASPVLLGQKTFTALDTLAANAPVSGGVYAYAVGNYPVVNPVSLSINPGGLLSYNAATNVLSVVRQLTPSDDGTYTGQLSVTQNGTTLTQPISLIVQPPRTYPVGASNCPSSPPPAAQRAGFTFMAYCLDPASARYQTLSNWFECTDGTFPAGFEWYSAWAALSCRDITFPTDSAGRTVLEFHWHSTDDINYMRSVQSSARRVIWNTSACTTRGCVPSVQMPIANAYWEYRAATYPIVTDNISPDFSPDIFTWVNCPTSAPPSCSDPIKPAFPLIELDFAEYNGPRAGGGGSAEHFWNNVSYGYSANNAGLVNTGVLASVIPGWSATQMRTYSTLVTGDAEAGLRMTGFVDDFYIPSAVSPIGKANPGGSLNPWDLGLLPTWDPLGFDDRSTLNSLQFWKIWFGGTFGLNTPDCQGIPACVSEGGQPDTFVDFEYIAGWTCPQYLTDPTCAGSTSGLAQ